MQLSLCHCCLQLARRGPRSETTGPMTEIISLVLGDDSPLRDDGPAVTYVLWAAAKLRYRTEQVSQEVSCGTVPNKSARR